MTTCAAKGCNARPAARGLCTKHLGLDAAGNRRARPGVVFVDKLPAPARHGRTPHPVDAQTAHTLRQHPGEWGIYPTSAKWPDAGEITTRALAQRLHSMKTRIAKAPAGVWRDGQFDDVVRDGQLYVRFVGPKEEAA